MNKLFLLILYVPLISCGGSRQVTEEIPFQWLSGNWKIDKENKQLTEKWWLDLQGNLQGEVWSKTPAGDSVQEESVKIIARRDKLFYVADVPGSEGPVYFDIKEMGDDYFIAENPYHDFPKKIQYNVRGDSLIAVVSGDGKEIEYRYARIDADR